MALCQCSKCQAKTTLTKDYAEEIIQEEIENLDLNESAIDSVLSEEDVFTTTVEVSFTCPKCGNEEEDYISCEVMGVDPMWEYPDDRNPDFNGFEYFEISSTLEFNGPNFKN